jgi:hypothetical protein
LPLVPMGMPFLIGGFAAALVRSFLEPNAIAHRNRREKEHT